MEPLTWTTDTTGRSLTTVDGVCLWRWQDTSGRWGVTVNRDGPGPHVGYTGQGSPVAWDRLARWVARCVREAP